MLMIIWCLIICLVLELSKLKQVDVTQEYLFSDINVRKKDENEIFIDISDIMQ